jgi:3-phosphoshikimate 1-carboxyvinyltransferase
MTLRIAAPTSKSMTQRALMIAALAEGDSIVERPLVCDDSRYLSAALRDLGVGIDWQGDRVRVHPGSLVPPRGALFCGNAGTAVRFTSCLSLLCDGTLRIDGDEHMQTRPIGALGESLEAMGVTVRYGGREGCPPLELTRRDAPPPRVSVDTSVSSQYASGLLMVAPRLDGGLTLELAGRKVSMPYVHMTVAMMRQAGSELQWRDERTIAVAGGGYRASDVERRLAVEPDWSAAAFLLAAGRIAGIDIEVADLPAPEASLQGDAAFAEMLRALNGPGPHRFVLDDAPDLIAPLCAAALFADGPTEIRGAAHTRVKECDRVAVLCRELSKLGARMRAYDDGLDVEPLSATPADTLQLDPDDDHRMAMAFGLASLRCPGIEVSSPDCVSKSFPDFWSVLATIRERMRAPTR